MRRRKAEIIEKYENNINWMQGRFHQVRCKDFPNGINARVDIAGDFEQIIIYCRNCLDLLQRLDEIDIIGRKCRTHE